jgi:hypothetical protein
MCVVLPVCGLSTLYLKPALAWIAAGIPAKTMLELVDLMLEFMCEVIRCAAIVLCSRFIVLLPMGTMTELSTSNLSSERWDNYTGSGLSVL